jgi:uncharacterized membrane protein (Fun14 family)
VRDHLSTNWLLAVAGVLFAAVLAIVVMVPNFVVGMVMLVLAGLARTAVVSTFNAELQIFVPVWVRGRALAMHLVTLRHSSPCLGGLARRRGGCFRA